MSEQQVFEIICEICESFTEVIVVDVDETPCFCPMCGETVEVQ